MFDVVWYNGRKTGEMRMTNKQKAFIAEYLVDRNAAAAARRCSMDERYCAKLLHKPEVKAYITEQMEQLDVNRIMQADELLELLSSLGRGVNCTRPVQLRALSQLAKMQTVQSALDGGMQVIIVDDVACDDCPKFARR